MGNCNCASAKADEPPPQHKKPKAQAAVKQNGAAKGAPKDLESIHHAIRLLGRGAAADTWLCADRAKKRLVAVKLFPRPIPHAQRDSVLREITCQAELGPGDINLINVYEAILMPDHLALVMEVAEGGSLTTYVAEQWAHATAGGLILTEDEGRYFFRQFVEAVDYCHQHGVAHRDLKLDNTLMDGQKPPFLKICDFGFARHFDQKHGLDRSVSHIGTPEYMSPELLQQNQEKGKGKDAAEYDPCSVDVWASGVMLTVALCGAFPFDHTRAHEGFQDDQELDLWLQEVNKQWSESPFLADNIKALSPEARDLLDKIFQTDPKKRITIPQIMQHPWYTKALRPEHEEALRKLHQEQAQVDAHMQHRKIDTAKAEERLHEIERMVDEACSREAYADASTHGRQLRPLHVIDGGASQLARVDLTEQAVMVGGSCTCSRDQAAVADRSAGRMEARSGKLHESE